MTDLILAGPASMKRSQPKKKWFGFTEISSRSLEPPFYQYKPAVSVGSTLIKTRRREGGNHQAAQLLESAKMGPFRPIMRVSNWPRGDLCDLDCSRPTVY